MTGDLVTVSDVAGRPGDLVKRDRNGWPLILQDDGKRKPYRRSSKMGELVESRWALEKWGRRMVAQGLVARDDLRLAIVAAAGDKNKIDRLCSDAIDAAKGSAAATTGTAMHSFTDVIDTGSDLPDHLPDEVRADLDAYVAATTGVFEHVHVEPFVVCDAIQAAGSPDRLSRLTDPTQCCDLLHVVDLKTGRSIKYGALAYSMQLASYAHADLYDPATETRTPVEVCRRRGVIVHLPAGTGKASLHWIDLEAGWEFCAVALAVDEARKRKGVLFHDGPRPAAAPDGRTIADQIADTRTVAELEALWHATHARWTAIDLDRARAHRAWLNTNAA